MRECPNCGEPIQDEAVYCKHCHTDVEQPLWTTSMRRCPYCAEWIDLENENCQECGKHVGTVDLSESSAFVDSLLNDDFLDDLPASERTASEPAGQSPFFAEDLAELEQSLPADEDSDAGPDFASLFAEADAVGSDQSPLEIDDRSASFSDDLAVEEPDPAEAEPERPRFERPTPDYSRGLRHSLIGEAEEEPEPLYSSEPESLYSSEPESLYSSEPESMYRSESGSAEMVEPETYAEPEPDPEPLYQPEPEPDPGYQSSPAPISSYRSPLTPVDDEALSPQPAAAAFETRSSIWASELEPSDEPATDPVAAAQRRSLPAGLLQGLIGLILIGGIGYGAVLLVRGPAGEMLSEALATDAPTATSTPLPPATLRSAPTLPPETQTAAEATEAGPAVSIDCQLWDQITLDNEGQELCVYGVIRRWFAVSEVPFVAIFSEDAGTFAIVDRTTTPPVGPGDCIVARGPVEVMSRTRPDIDLAGTLELCPEEWLAEG